MSVGAVSLWTKKTAILGIDFANKDLMEALR